MTSKFEVAQHAANNLSEQRRKSLSTRAFFTGRVMAIGDDYEVGGRHGYLDSVHVVPEIRRPFASLVSIALRMQRDEEMYKTEKEMRAPFGTTDIIKYMVEINRKKFKGTEITIFTPDS